MAEESGEKRLGAPPIACNLSDAREVAARGAAVEDLFRGVVGFDELADGYEFTFPGDDQWAAKLIEFVATERKCCPFFVFELVFEQNCGPIRLRLSGSPGVKDFIRSWLLGPLP